MKPHLSADETGMGQTGFWFSDTRTSQTWIQIPEGAKLMPEYLLEDHNGAIQKPTGQLLWKSQRPI